MQLIPHQHIFSCGSVRQWRQFRGRRRAVPTINEHIQKIYADYELEEGATIRNFRIVQTEQQKKGASPNKIIVKTESIPYKSYKNAEKTFSAFFIYILTSFSSFI